MNEILENPIITSSPKRGRGRPKGSKTKISHGVLPTDKAVESPKEDKDLTKLKADKLTTLLRVTGSRYNTFDENEYRSRIEHMNLTDLQDECMRVGLKPNTTTETRNMTLDTLMSLFYDNKRSYVPDESGVNKTILSEDKRAKLLELMKVAR